MIRKVGDLVMGIHSEQAHAKAQIDNVKEVLASQTAEFEQQKDLIVRSLEAFCANHQEGFEGKRSRNMAFGSVGWRKSTKIKTKRTILEKIIEFFGPKKSAQYIRTKQEPDKEALAKLDDVQLKQVHCTRETTDDFFVDPDVPGAVDYSD